MATNNGQLTKRFFDAIDDATRDEIIESIADHYGITRDAARQEVTDDDAEHLLDYMIEPMRTATSALMQRHSLR